MVISTPRCVVRIALLLSSTLAALAQPLQLVPLHASGFYAVGETVGWTVSVKPGTATPAGTRAYTLKFDNARPLRSGTIDLSQGPARIEARVTEPAMLYLEIAPVTATDKPQAAGAAVSPEKLQPVVARPADFDAFWAAKLAQLQQIPVEPVVTAGESEREGVEYATIRLNNINGSHVYGQLAKPARPGRFPAVLQLQWAGGPYPLQKSWVVDRAAQGWLALNVEPHDVPGNLPPAFYEALPALIKQYPLIYNDDRDRCYFLRMFLGDYRALEYLASRPEWDGHVLVLTGGSMGGMQSFAVAGLNPKATHVIVDVPAGADTQAVLHGRHESYPNWDVANPRVRDTAPYFDPVNFASRIHATCLVSMGFLDNVSAPTGIWTVFNQLAGPKEAVPLVEAAHNHQSTPEQMRPYTLRSAEWLGQLVKGEPLQLRPLPSARD
jgi:cephalosporin-C deacetylase-like acetyl esterase